jgi:hypothetical protein
MNPVSAGNRGRRRFGAAQSIVLSVAALGLLAALAWIFASPNRIRAQNSGGPATRYVPGGGNLQQALDAANPGDTILLEAGATYTGNFLLRAKQGDAPIPRSPARLWMRCRRSSRHRRRQVHAIVTPNADSPATKRAATVSPALVTVRRACISSTSLRWKPHRQDRTPGRQPGFRPGLRRRSNRGGQAASR